MTSVLYSSDENEDNYDVNSSPSDKILWASENGNVEIVSTLIAEDESVVNTQDSDHYSPLHRASYNNHPDVVKILIKSGASLSSKTLDGWTPLHSACRWNSYECASILLSEGADVNATTNSGQTPLHLAASTVNSKETLQLLLLDFLIDTTIKNSNGETAKDLAIRSGPFAYMFEGSEDVFNPF